MFTFNHFASLIKAGYTEDQIKDLYRIFGTDTPATPNPTTAANTQTQTQNQNTAAPATATTNPNTTPSTTPFTTPNPAPTVSTSATATARSPETETDVKKNVNTAGTVDTETSETKQMLAEMLGLMRRGYINQSGPDVKKETAESVLATILSPSGISI